jgi:UPF0148 protein
MVWHPSHLNLIKTEIMKNSEGYHLSDNSDRIRSMADLLRSGATLTDLACPACSSPLFRLKNGDLWCAQCQKKVVVVREGEQIEEIERSATLGPVESTLLAKIEEIDKKIQSENDIDELQRLNVVMAMLLENLERVKKIGRYRT